MRYRYPTKALRGARVLSIDLGDGFEIEDNLRRGIEFDVAREARLRAFIQAFTARQLAGPFGSA